MADDLGMPYHTLHGWVRAVRRSKRKPVQKVQPTTKADAEARVRELEAEVRKLMLERNIQESGGVLRAGAAVKYAFIRDVLARACTVRMACRLLEVSPSGYYRSLKAPVAARKVRRRAVFECIEVC